MALSGNAVTGFTNNGAFQLVTEWTATQNVSGNYSDVTAHLYIQSLQGWASVSDSTTSLTSITINGDRKEFQAYSTTAAWEKKWIGSHSVRVAHTSDGSKQIPIASSHNFDISWNGSWVGTVYTETWPWLNTIARASAIWTSDTSGAAITQNEYGNTIRVNVTKSDDSFKHSVGFYLHDHYVLAMDKGTATTAEFAIPLTYMNEIPDVGSMWGKVAVDTWTSDNVYVGGTEVWWQCFVPASIKPSIGSLAVTDLTTAATTLLGAGNYAQGISVPNVTMNSVTTAYSSPIVLYEFLFEGKVYNHTGATLALGKPTSFGAAQVITCNVKDARGRWATGIQTTIKVLAYSPPAITTFNGTRQSPTTTVNAYRKGVISPLHNGTANKNTTNVKVEYRTSGSTGAYTLGNNTVVTNSFDASIQIGTAFAIETAYEIRLTVTDSFSTAVVTTNTVGAVVKPFSIGSDGIGAGKIWTQGALDVLGDSYLTGNVTVTGTEGNVYHTGKKPTLAEIGAEAAIVSGSNANGGYIKFADGTMVCYGTTSHTAQITTPYNSMYYDSTQRAITFPVSFYSQASVSAGGYDCFVVSTGAGTTGATYWIYRVSSNTDFPIKIQWTAWGRWKA